MSQRPLTCTTYILFIWVREPLVLKKTGKTTCLFITKFYTYAEILYVLL